MTPCTRYPDDDLVMRYVTGDLAEPELSTFEDHLFACDACLARVERYQAAQQVLQARHLPAMPTMVPAPDAAASTSSRLSWWVLSSIAAALVVGLGAVFLLRGSAPATRGAEALPAPSVVAAGVPPAMASAPGARTAPSLQVAVLAMVTPPPYLSIVTRGEAGPQDGFAAGMVAYTRADWATASRALREIDSPQARFYLGIADLMRGETATAVAALESVRRSARQPYARESLFYLGKAALQRGDVSTGREWFTAARAANAGPEGEAARLLAELDEITVDVVQSQKAEVESPKEGGGSK